MKISYRKKRSLRGYAFISVWLLGTLLWFIIPVISSAGYSFFEFNPSDRNAERQWQGLDNYIYAFTADASYSEYLWKSVRETAVMTPLIVIFSLFSAVLLNHKFKGRSFAAAVFFIPVIVASGPVYNIISDDIAKAVTEAKAGKIEYRLDKTNIIHCPIGKASFGAEKLDENFSTLMDAIVKAKPAAAKGTYLKSCTVTSTMGVGIPVATNKYGV